MNTFFTRWSTAMMTTAAATVLTVGVVSAADHFNTSDTDRSAAPATVVDLSADNSTPVPEGGCPLDANGTAPASPAAGTPATDTPAGDTPVVDEPVIDAPVVTGAPDIGSSPVGLDPTVPSVVDPVVVDPAAPGVVVPDVPAPVDPGSGNVPQIGALERVQLIDLVATLGHTGLALDVPSADGSLVDLGRSLDAGHQRDADTVALITVDIDAADSGSSLPTVSVAIDDVLDLGVLESQPTLPGADVGTPPVPGNGAAQDDGALIVVDDLANGNSIANGNGNGNGIGNAYGTDVGDLGGVGAVAPLNVLD